MCVCVCVCVCVCMYVCVSVCVGVPSGHKMVEDHTPKACLIDLKMWDFVCLFCGVFAVDAKLFLGVILLLYSS